MQRDYNAAVAALNTLQSNFSIVDAIRKSGRGANKQAIPEMVEWCRRMGYEPSHFNRLRCIHVAGTKGKGSTSAFISSILAHYLHSPPSKLHKIGLYTSPHLRFVRERIQINDAPLSEVLFARYFFEVWDRLEAWAHTVDLGTDAPAKPVYFRFLTLVAFHSFLSEGVDSAVIECGIGGEYDSTNIIEQPTVSAITSLGIDHVAMLGETLEEIAWHKAGIMKRGAVACSVEQSESAMKVLQERAKEKAVKLIIVPRHPDIDEGKIQLGLAADFQKINASLAVTVAAAHLRTLGHDDIPNVEQIQRQGMIPDEFKRGLLEVKWGGRCETRREKGITWHIDGGHTLESIEVAAKWFAEEVSVDADGSRRGKRLLLFNQQTRDAEALAKALHRTLAGSLGDEQPFTHAVFCTNVTFSSSGYRPDLVSINTNTSDVDALRVQRSLAKVWKTLDPDADVKVVPAIEEAITWARQVAAAEEEFAKDTQEALAVLVTGSLHLVGGVIEVLESQDNGAG